MDARLKRSGTTAKAERDRTMTMNCPAKPTQRTVEPEAHARAINTHVAYEDRDVINNPSIYAEMVQKSGQSVSRAILSKGKGYPHQTGSPIARSGGNLACAISRPPHQPAKCGPRT